MGRRAAPASKRDLVPGRSRTLSLDPRLGRLRRWPRCLVRPTTRCAANELEPLDDHTQLRPFLAVLAGPRLELQPSLDQNGDVDLLDLAELMGVYGTTCP